MVSGRQAVEAVQQRIAAGSAQYKLIFMDLNMPVLNGLDTTRALRELCAAASPSFQPFIVGVTGDSGPDVEHECQQAGMNRIGTLCVR